MRLIKIIDYDGKKGKGSYIDSKTLEIVKFTYHKFIEGEKLPAGNAYVDDDGNIYKNPPPEPEPEIDPTPELDPTQEELERKEPTEIKWYTKLIKYLRK